MNSKKTVFKMSYGGEIVMSFREDVVIEKFESSCAYIFLFGVF